MRRHAMQFGFVLAVVLAANAAVAVEPDERLVNPALEARARDLSAGLRCLICQNQSIDDSSAPLARDLRVLVRQRLAAGDTDADVERFIVARYGEFVLLRPRLNVRTLILWLAPFALLVAISAALWRRARQQAAMPATIAAPLTADEQMRLDGILADSKPDA